MKWIGSHKFTGKLIGKIDATNVTSAQAKQIFSETYNVPKKEITIFKSGLV